LLVDSLKPHLDLLVATMMADRRHRDNDDVGHDAALSA
jgi:hypothetical protein